jgi:hypothetical protein
MIRATLDYLLTKFITIELVRSRLRLKPNKIILQLSLTTNLPGIYKGHLLLGPVLEVLKYY